LTSIAGGGRSREPGEMWNIQVKSTTSFDDGGYVCTYVTESSVQKIDKCGATDLPKCVNYRSSRDPHDMNFPTSDYLTGTQIGTRGIPVFDEGWAKLKVKTGNAAIIRGDFLIVDATGGKVNKLAAGATIPDTSATNAANEIEARLLETARIVGIAEEIVAVGTTAAPGADKVLTRLRIGSVPYVSV
jgi:hypothetical protein